MTTIYYSADKVTINTNWNIPNNTKVVVLIGNNKDLEINKNITVPVGSFLAFIVSGNINIKGTVGDKDATPTPDIEGVYIADGTINTNYDNDNSGKRLAGFGVFVAHANLDNTGGFVFGRDLKADNRTTPAEYFEHRPDFLVNFPKEIGTKRMVWKEVAP